MLTTYNEDIYSSDGIAEKELLEKHGKTTHIWLKV